jgi:hypothetical protein
MIIKKLPPMPQELTLMDVMGVAGLIGCLFILILIVVTLLDKHKAP